MTAEKKSMKISSQEVIFEKKDMLTKALDIYNSGSTSYSLPKTFGRPKNDKTLAMDKCIEGIIDTFSDEWRALSVPKFLGYSLLSSLAQEPLIRSGIETITDDMTRKFISLSSMGDIDNSEKISEIEKDLKAYRVKSIFNKALSITGYMGGCLVYIDVGDLEDDEKILPLYLDSKTFRKGSFKGFKIIEPINVSPGTYNASNPTDENYFNPETWFVLGKEYHKSRFLYFAQNELPLLLKPLYNFFGLSLSQQVLEYVQNFTENRRSAQRLLNKFSLTIWKTDMSVFLGGGTCKDLEERVKFFNAQRSNDGTALIDKELEEMVQINTPLSGVTDIVSMSLDLAPVILGISKDKYFGDLPKGLNASSEGTNRIYYDKIHSLNEKICYDNVEKVLKILQLNRFGEIDESICFEFAPLWEMDEKQRAEINKIEADISAVYVDRGILSQEEVRQNLADNPNSGYSNIDVDEVPENDTFSDVYMDDKDEDGSVFDGAQDESWITIGSNEETGKKGTHIPVEEGESHYEATKRFLSSKGKSIKPDRNEAKEENNKTEVVKQTFKGLLVRKNGKQAWIQKRWMREDGTLTKAGEKAISEGENVKDIQKEEEEREKGVILPEKADYESDKAFGYKIDLFVDTEHYDHVKEDVVGNVRKTQGMIFIPKSLIKEGRIPAWLVEKKIEELELKFFETRAGTVVSSAHIPSIFGKSIYTSQGKSKIAFTKEKEDFEKNKYSKYFNTEQAKDEVIAFDSGEIYAVINDELCVSNDKGENFVTLLNNCSI